MSLSKEMKDMISKMESDLNDVKKAQSRKYLDDYEQGFIDGSVEIFESSLKLIKIIEKKLDID